MSIGTSAVVPILIPPAPYNVRAPELVEKLEAASEFNKIPVASKLYVPCTSISIIPASISKIEPASVLALINIDWPAVCADVIAIWPSAVVVSIVISSWTSISNLPASISKIEPVSAFALISIDWPAVWDDVIAIWLAEPEVFIVIAAEASISNVEALTSIVPGVPPPSVILPLKSCVVISVPSEIPIWTVLEPPVAIFTLWSWFSVAISILPPDESNETSPEAFISNVDAFITIGLSALVPILIPVSESNDNVFEESISIIPVVFISIPPVPESISIPPPPPLASAEIFNASAPVPVELNTKLESTFPVNPIVKSWPLPLDSNDILEELAIPSILNDKASRVIAVLLPLPFPNASVPEPCGSILIFELLPEVVIFITPPAIISITEEEVISIPPALAVICKASAPVPVELNTKLESLVPVIPIVKSSSSPSVANVIFEASPAASILNDLESRVIAVLVLLPIPTVPEPCGSILIFELLPEVIIFIAPPDVISITEEEVISIPPALAVTCKASAAVPVELNIKLALTPAASIAIVKSPSVVAVCDILLAPPALLIANWPVALISIPVEVIIILFAAAIVKSAPLPKIYSFGLPYWICFPEVNNKPNPGACVNDTSLVVPNDNIVLSFCNLILLRTILSWFEFNTFVFT